MNTKPSIWTDTPPKENTKCWVRPKDNLECEFVADWNGVWLHAGGVNMRPQHYQFGPRIPSAEELAGLYAAAAELAEIKRAWGMGAMRDERGE